MPDTQGRDFLFEVHPYAAQFPMLSDDELLELAQDIKQRGLEHAIMLSTDGSRLLDGRNRASACALAGVEPRFDRLPEGRDEIAYIISVNIRRRHLTKGQHAVALAMAYPEPARRGGRRDRGSMFPNETLPVGRKQLSEAREIVRHQDLAQMVMSGAAPFDAALKESRWRVEHAKDSVKFLRELQAEAEDLADEVTSGQRRLYDAWMAYRARQRAAVADVREVREAALQALQRAQIVWHPRLRADAGFRAGIIDRLKIEPDRVEDVLLAIDALMAVLREADE